jgi:putative endonuclease
LRKAKSLVVIVCVLEWIKRFVSSSDFSDRGRKIVSRTHYQAHFKSSKMKIYYVYILKCSDKTYCTGFTSNLEQRFFEHQEGKHIESYTYKRRPLELVFYFEFSEVGFAIDTEKQIKKWSKIKKEALINNEYEKLLNLAKKKFK